MSNLSKLEFAALDISGNNYLPWTLDAKIHLTANNLGETIKSENGTTAQEKAKAMIFLRHHLHEDLKREYLTVEDPLDLWNSIKDRFDHQKLVILPKARNNFVHIRLQDFKTVSEYNSALFRITSELKLCGEKITDEIMLEKTFSTFHPSNVNLAEQYRTRGFRKYSELISCLLVAEQNKELLLQNHNTRPTGSSPFPEANVANYNSRRGRGRGRGGPRRGRGRGRSNTWHREPYYKNHNSKNNAGESSSKGQGGQNNQNMGRPPKGKNTGTQQNNCYRCGMSNHWSRNCRTPKHLVEAYQGMIKDKGKNIETNLIEDSPIPSAQTSDTHLDVCDFIENADDY